ncbi:carbonic anhydrase family protein [Vagococcus elongatus]|uniref:carbonic anhydrase family protein n=1 Tax=Vagococcus elongatus TaxID=180344 RepID=UPI0014769B25|nr:carbonic anhydrase family protein [Vagococcus elongatus]
MKSTAKSFIPQWDYSSKERGPENWAQLCHDFCTAENTGYQSPIHLAMKKSSTLDKNLVEFSYTQEIFRKSYYNHTLQLESTGFKNTLVVDGSTYRLHNIHYHIPSEHHINNQQSQLEFHLVHRNAQDEIVVVGVLFNVEAVEEDVLKNHSSADSQWYESKKHVALNPAMLLPDKKSYFHYQGSLTTPPTRGNVKWFVFSDSLNITQKHFQKLKNHLSDSFNNRPLQELNGRTVWYHS